MEVDSLLKAVIFAFVAGLVLNVMPCVLPVVSLKILSFVQDAQGSGRRAAFMGFYFAAGIITVFLILGALASFAGYGWGELFQKQAFILGMIVVLFAMAMSLFDLFHLPVPQFAVKADALAAGQGYVGCFSRGMLATFLATPCSGPLLGGAMAWTLRQSPPLIFVIFASMGLGMAAPYIILAISPAALRWLPRPGPWLLHFERLMGFALLATVVYLLKILPGEMRVWVVLFCLFLGLGLYIWGQMTTLRDSTRRRLMVRIVALLVIVGGWWLSLHVFPPITQPESPTSGDGLSWEPYALEKLLAAAATQRWVVVWISPPIGALTASSWSEPPCKITGCVRLSGTATPSSSRRILPETIPRQSSSLSAWAAEVFPSSLSSHRGNDSGILSSSGISTAPRTSSPASLRETPVSWQWLCRPDYPVSQNPPLALVRTGESSCGFSTTD
jgi:thiol:disulfide interchange protein